MVEQEDEQDAAWSLMALSLQSLQPPDALRARLQASVAGCERHLPFARALAPLFDLTPEHMGALLRASTEDERWQTGLLPGFRTMHFQPGPSIVEHFAGFAQMPAGFEIPAHDHLAEELVFVLDGLLVQGDGGMFGRGQLMRNGPGDVHTVSVIETCTVVALVTETLSAP